MHLVRAGLDCRERIDHAESAILMAVPVEANASALFVDDVFYEAHNSSCAVGSRVSDGVADANRFGATANGGRVEGADRLGFGAGRVFSHVHDRKALAYSKRDGFLSHLQKLLERPVFSKKTHGRRTDESARFDRDSSALRDLDDGYDVVAVCAPGAIWPDL